MTKRLELDGNKMIHHLDRVQDWKAGKVIYPIYIAFSPTSLCNHKCTFCVYHYKEFKPIFFPADRYDELVQEWSSLKVKSLFFAGDGEPLLHKNAVSMIQKTRAAGIDIAMNTNGRLLSKEKSQALVNDLDWIRISVNGGTAKNYAQIHQTNEKDFEIVLSNLQDLVRQKRNQKSKITIGVQCVLLNENQHEIENLAKQLKEIEVDYFAVKPFLKHPLTEWETELENPREVIKRLLQLESLNSESFRFVLRESHFQSFQKRTYGKCLSGDFMIEVDALGDVYSCGPYIGDLNHRYGNILEQSFESMWKSDECRSKIKNIQCQLDVSKCMPFCRPDSVNKFLWDLKNPPEHLNYI